MNTHPIIMDGESVRALLNGCKTQTRRVVKPQPTEDWGSPLLVGVGHPTKVARNGEAYPGEPIFAAWFDDAHIPCPYGQPGDLLWVRETWCRFGHDPIYRADYGRFTPISDGIGGPWKSPIHMPVVHSRLTLELTSVRAERVMDISTHDCLAEGVKYPHCDECTPDFRAVMAFRDRWDSINAKRGFPWDSNPWVWALTFKVHRANVDKVLEANE